jgi:hypothetical protein
MEKVFPKRENIFIHIRKCESGLLHDTPYPSNLTLQSNIPPLNPLLAVEA